MGKQPPVSGIYAILHFRTGKRYVGSAGDIRNRWSVHKFHLRRGTHHSQHLQRAWNKYGESEFLFIVLARCQIDMLAVLEQRAMDATPKLKLMNCHPIARTARGYKMSTESRKRMSDAAIRISANADERKRRSDRARRQHSQGRLGRRRATEPKMRSCKTCQNQFKPHTLPTGRFSQTDYCSTCRPVQHGGYYKHFKP